MSKRTLIQMVASRYRNRLRECRLKALVPTQEKLARMTGIPRPTISSLENQRLFLSAPYALLIARALGCTLDDLYEEPAANEGARRGQRSHAR